ncbi:hypothetical protein VTL71DRAFT_3784 [Oculimacula yallundae]|uniref:DUF6590 domain-containing protein n=1 Tax=Oculimacula yallundae TaxID=86028 RepID=A0ABR4C3Y7_9HELO
MSSQSQKHGPVWSKWDWSDDYKCYTRWRKNSMGEVLWEYDYQQLSDQGHNPGNALSLGTVPEGLESTSSQYTYDGGNGEGAMASNTQQFSSLTLNNFPSTTPGPSPSYQTSQQNYNGPGQYHRGNIRDNSGDNRTGRARKNKVGFSHQDGPTPAISLPEITVAHMNAMTKVIIKLDILDSGSLLMFSRSCGQNLKGQMELKSPSGEEERRLAPLKSSEDSLSRKTSMGIASACKSLRNRFESEVGLVTCPNTSARPILTYGGRATLKPGVHVEHHTVIYTDKIAGARLLPGEKLSKTPLQMEPNDNSQRLDKASRVNYAKLYTVEHNVKVFFIGSLTKESKAELGIAYNAHHRYDEETDVEDNLLPQGPSRTYTSSNDDQQYGGMATTADTSYDRPRILHAASDYTVPLGTGELSTYSMFPRGRSRGSDVDDAYTHKHQSVDSDSSSQTQYRNQEHEEQSDAERTPRGAVTPEDPSRFAENQNASSSLRDSKFGHSN